jgi:hypothetical protein
MADSAVIFSAGDMMALILSDVRRTLGLVKEPHPGAPVNGKRYLVSLVADCQ